MAARTVFKGTVIDQDTGEVLDEQKITVLDRNESEFVFLYSKHFNDLMRLNGVELKVFLFCAVNSTVNRNKIGLIKDVKDELAREADISFNSITNAISSLMKKGFLERLGSCNYKVNSKYAWRGYAKKRDYKPDDNGKTNSNTEGGSGQVPSQDVGGGSPVGGVVPGQEERKLGDLPEPEEQRGVLRNNELFDTHG